MINLTTPTQPISAVILPLPTGAATAANQGTALTSLATIVTNTGNIPANLTVTSSRLLVDGSGVTQPVSLTTLPAFATIPTFTINQGTPGTTNRVFIGSDGTVTANAGTDLNTSALALESGGNLASINTKTPSLGQALAAASVPVVLTAAQISTLTPPAAITGFATETTLASILTSLNGNVNFNETIWTDDTGAYFARRVTQNLDTNAITVSYFLPDNSSYTPGANPRPLSAVDREVRSTSYAANANGTGYTDGDIILRTDIFDVNTLTITASLWYNASAKTNIAAPTPADIDYVSSGVGGSTSALQTTLNGLVGALTETAPATDTASSGLNGRLQRVAQNITALTALLPTALGAGGGLKIDGSGTALPVSGTFWQATQPISAAALPLPTGAATETTLSSIDTKTPALGQALAAASVPVVLTAAQLSTLTPLSSVSITGTLPAFASTPTVNIGTAPVIAVTGTFFQATQPVSVASLPLPTGAATSALQSSVQAAGGSSASAANAVQGIIGGRPVPVSGGQYTLASNLTTTGPASGVSFPGVFKTFSVQLQINSGTVGAISAEVQISGFNGGWQTVATMTDIANGGIMILTPYPATWMRINLVSLTGTSPDVSYNVMASV